MAGVNFGLQQPLPVGGAIAQLPVVRQENGVDSLASGIMSGLAQGQGMQAQALDMKYKQQKMGQEAEMFPIEKRNAEAVAGTNELKFKDAQEAYQYAQEKKAAALQGESNYLKVLEPQERQKYLNDKATYEFTVAETAKSSADTKTKQLENSLLIQDQIGAANSAALQFQDPKQQEEAYQQIRSTLPPDVQKLMKPTFDIKFAPIAITTATVAHSQYMEYKHGRAGTAQDTEKVSTLKQLQTQRTKLEQQIASGTGDSAKLQQELKETNDLIGTHTTNKSTVENVQGKATEEKMKVDADGLKQIQAAAGQADELDAVLNKAEELVEQIGDAAQGPLIGNVSEYWNDDVQTLDALANRAQGTMRQIMKVPAAGFSDADAARLERSVFGKKKDMKSNLAVIEDLRSMAKTARDNMKRYKEQYDSDYGLKQKTAVDPLQAEYDRRFGKK